MNKEALEFGIEVFNHGIYSNGSCEDFEKLLKMFNIEINRDIEDVVLENIEKSKLSYDIIDKIYKLPLFKYIVFLKGGGTFIVYEYIPSFFAIKMTGSWMYAELITNIFLPFIFNKYEIEIIIKEFYKRKKGK